MSKKTYVKLRDAGTVFYHMASGTKVAGDQIVEVEKSIVSEAVKNGLLNEVTEKEYDLYQAETAEAKKEVLEAHKPVDISALKAAHEEEIAQLEKDNESLGNANAQYLADIEVLNTTVSNLQKDVKKLEADNKKLQAQQTSK